MSNCPLTLRITKGSKLTFAELDGNFISLSNCITALGNDLYSNFLPLSGGTLTGPLTACTSGIFVDDLYSCNNDLTVWSNITIEGNVVINGSATTINTEIIQSQDNSITLNYSGTHLTAISGGIIVEDGQSDGVDSSILTDTNGNWVFTPGITSSTLSACTGIWTSNLYGCSPITVHDNIQSVGSLATGLTSFAFGYITKAFGNYSHAEGYQTSATTQYSHAEGYQTNTLGTGSHAEGLLTTASGDYSHAEGESTVAFGTSSHAEGTNTTASGYYSHAEGQFTTASGNYSHAEGKSTTAIGNNSHTEGFGTVSNGNHQHVQGLWNLTGNTTQGAFILGNGTSNSNRSNLIFAAGNQVNISGKTITTNFQMTSGATNGYVLSSIDNNGNAQWGNLSSLYTGNTSGDCITDLYVSNIHSCSPLNINPLDEGNVYFGSTSGITVDVTNKRIGIGTNTPSVPLDVKLDASSPPEEIARFGISDDNNSYLSVVNSTLSPGQFMPAILGVNNTTDRQGLLFYGVGGIDSGTNPITHFSSNILISGSSYTDYSYSAVTTRPLFQWWNNYDPKMTMAANGNLGIGTTTPEFKLDTLGDYGRFYVSLDNQTTVATSLSGSSSGQTDISVVSPGSGLLQIGIIGSNVTGTTFAGKVKDSYIYSSIANNGLNIVSAPSGGGLDDYIRFYAGQLAPTGATPDIHIQGSGSTRGYVGIGTGTPTSKLNINGSTGFLNYDSDGVLDALRQSYLKVSTPSASATTAMVVNSGDYSLEFLTIGTGTTTTYGSSGDSVIYASSLVKNLNIVNGIGPGPDNIRFYAGQIVSTGTTPDLHIQGNGTTRGYVGIGTVTPTERLDVNGKTKTINFQMTSGATDGYVLTSDVSGNASWEPLTVSSGRFGIADSGGTYTYYSTLTSAISAATAGQTVEFFTDYTETGAVTITLKDGVNINGNGHTYTLNNNGTDSCLSDNGVSIKCSIINLTLKRVGATSQSNTNTTCLLVTGASKIDFNGSKAYGSNSVSVIINNSGANISNVYAYGDTSVNAAITVYIASGKMDNSVVYNNTNNAAYYTQAILNMGTIVNCVAYTTSGGYSIYNQGEMIDCVGYSTAVTMFGGGINNYGTAIGSNGFSSGGNGFFAYMNTFNQNCNGYSSGGVGFTVNGFINCKVMNCNGFSSASYGIYVYNGYIINSTAWSTVNYGLYNTNAGDGLSNISNCTVTSDSSAALFCNSNTNTVISNNTITSRYNNASGHAVVLGATVFAGPPNPDILNNTLIVANASANCIYTTIASTIKYSSNVFKNSATPINANITQGIVNTQDNQGNILI